MTVVSIILFDALAGWRGHRGRLWSGLRSSLVPNTRNSVPVDKKLNELSNNITSLTNRLARVEESLSKLDSKFEKKVVFPSVKSNKPFREMSLSNESNYDGLREEKNDELFSANSKQEDFPFDFEKAAPAIIGIQRQLRFIHGIETGYGIPDGFSFEKTEDKKFSAMNKPLSAEVEKGNQKTAKKTEKSDKITSPSKDLKQIENTVKNPNMKTESVLERDNLPPVNKDETAISYSSSSPNPKTSDMKDQKIDIPLLTNSPTRIIHLESNKPIDFSEIFPDLNKEDPVIEVKRFDDYKSFKKFGDSVKKNENQKNDGSVDTKYFKMSDILNSNKNAYPSISKPAAENKDEQKPAETRDMDYKFEDHDLFGGASNIHMMNEAVKKNCEEYKDPEEAFQMGICTFKSKDAETVSKEAKMNEKNKPIDELEKERSQNSKLESEANLSAKEKFTKESQASKNIQSSFSEEKTKPTVLEIQITNEKNSQSGKNDSPNMIIEMIGTKLENKADGKEEDRIQKPTLISPVI